MIFKGHMQTSKFKGSTGPGQAGPAHVRLQSINKWLVEEYLRFAPSFMGVFGSEVL